jgi:membrane protein YqaA with SNARE-associated domain
MAKNYLKNVYDWLLHWADTPYGAGVLFLWALAESSFFPIPPDAFLIAMILGSRMKAFRFAAICSVASVVGGVLGYLIGYGLWWGGDGSFSPVAVFFFDHIPGFTEVQFNNIKGLYESWNFWIVFTAGFTPIPYKVITISAGAFSINFAVFVVASAISRAARFYLVSWLLWRYGASIKSFIDKQFGWLSIVFVLLLIGGFIAIKYIF